VGSKRFDDEIGKALYFSRGAVPTVNSRENVYDNNSPLPLVTSSFFNRLHTASAASSRTSVSVSIMRSKASLLSSPFHYGYERYAGFDL
jgi:hypothetical protein